MAPSPAFWTLRLKLTRRVSAASDSGGAAGGIAVTGTGLLAWTT
ncbi:hypothetical protein P4S72_16255 [Vibrio sp. PP-XX7]